MCKGFEVGLRKVRRYSRVSEDKKGGDEVGRQQSQFLQEFGLQINYKVFFQFFIGFKLQIFNIRICQFGKKLIRNVEILDCF